MIWLFIFRVLLLLGFFAWMAIAMECVYVSKQATILIIPVVMVLSVWFGSLWERSKKT